ncbi:85/88 kDa calcium-independent phospholipase A2-like protein, partial [Dinothrombium tinctorium]
PGWIQTETTDGMGLKFEEMEDIQKQPIKKIGRPDDVANCVTFLASEESGLITGECLQVDGGAVYPIIEYPWNKVVEVKLEDYIRHQVCDREECLLMYSLDEINLYEIVLQKDIPNKSQTAFSICRFKQQSEAEKVFHLLKDKVPPLHLTCPQMITADTLQEVFSYIQENPTQHFVHICSHFGYVDALKYALTENPALVNLIDEASHKTPLLIATKKARLNAIQLLMTFKPNLDVSDKDGNNVLHFAATTNKEIIQCICNGLSQSPTEEQPSVKKSLILKLINTRNGSGFSPLHLACADDKPDCVKELLKNGADVNGASISDKCCSETITDNLNKQVIDQLEHKDMKNGGTPLHWTKSPQCLEPLLEMGCDINALNFQGETVLHVMVAKSKLPCIVTLLSYGADVNSLGPNGNTPLHLAVKGGDVSIVQALVVFRANVNCENSSGETPRHIAATSKKSPSQEMILYILHTVGAKRCKTPSSQSQCNDGCSVNCFFNGNPIESSPFNRITDICDSLLGQLTVENAVSTKQKSFQNGDIMNIDKDESTNIRLLCLDGGGVRGLILIQMLSVLEDMMHMKICDCFDWIAGTSTGAILALYIGLGNSANECRRLYFRLKDKIFVGLRPYDSEPFEKFLRQALGEETKMTDIVKPKYVYLI